MEVSFVLKKEELLAALQEEPYLSDAQREALEDLLRTTEKPLVLSMVEDLLQRLLKTRAENYLLITRKIHQTLRTEKRRLSERQEQQENVENASVIKELLQNMS